MKRKVFSLKEANYEIPSINEEVLAIKAFQQDFINLHQQLKSLRPFHNKQHHSPINDNIFLLECRLEFMNILANLHINNIESKGVLLKNIESGIIDFPALHQNQFVYYSWKLGENEVLYYHTVSEGYQERKLIH